MNEENYIVEESINENNPVQIDDVVITPSLDLTIQKHKMDYFLDPRKELHNINIARAINSGYIDEETIRGWRPDLMKYNPNFHRNRSDFYRQRRTAKHNKRVLNKAMKYAGSDQQSAADREFYHKLGVATTGIVGSLPAAYATGTLLGAGIYGAPWIATNIALPFLGGEVLNETTRKVSDGYYNSFGDFVYRSTPLDNWTRDTWTETPAKFIADMSNPGYWAPYRKVAGYAMDGFKSLSSAYDNLPIKIKFTPRENFRYRNIGGDDTGVLDLLESGVVRPPSNETLPKSKTILLRKTFTIPFFGHKGKMVDAKSYPGKWFLGAEDVGNFYRPKRNQWGFTSREPLTINDVTINRRIFPRMTNSPYIEMSGSKVNDIWRFGNSNSQPLLYNPFNKGSRLGAELYKVEFPTPIYRTGYHVTRYAGDVEPHLFPDQYVDDLGNTIKLDLDNYSIVRHPNDNIPVNTYWRGGDEINYTTASPEIGLHVGATESPGRILMSRQFNADRTVPPVVREVTWIDYPGSTRTMPDITRWNASAENKKLWENIGAHIDDNILTDDLYKPYGWFYEQSTTRNIEALRKANGLLDELRRIGISSIQYGNKYEIPWGWKHIDGNFYSTPTGRKIEWPGGESHAIITPEAWWSKNRRYTPPVPDEDDVIPFGQYIRNND